MALQQGTGNQSTGMEIDNGVSLVQLNVPRRLYFVRYLDDVCVVANYTCTGTAARVGTDSHLRPATGKPTYELQSSSQ